MSQVNLSKKYITLICRNAIKEDLKPFGDITSNLLKKDNIKRLKMVSNQRGILGGLDFAKETFRLVDKKINIKILKKEGSLIKKGSIIAIVEGDLKKILVAERVALNFVSLISGIASYTNKFVRKVGKKTKICCTRKTIPTIRKIQKYAVKLGGGYNHRYNLSDEFLIKDNHFSNLDDLTYIIKKSIKSKYKKKITVEVDNLRQLNKINGLKFDRILLDNMNIKTLKLAVKLTKQNYETEASGSINIKNVSKIASTGVDRISIGSLTHSFKSMDIKLEI